MPKPMRGRNPETGRRRRRNPDGDSTLMRKQNGKVVSKLKAKSAKTNIGYAKIELYNLARLNILKEKNPKLLYGDLKKMLIATKKGTTLGNAIKSEYKRLLKRNEDLLMALENASETTKASKIKDLSAGVKRYRKESATTFSSKYWDNTE